MAAQAPLKKLSVTQAIIAGTLFVNMPVLALILSPMLLIGLLENHGVIQPSQKWLVAPGFLCGIGAAWLWWSLTIPRWRLWAYGRVADIPALKEAAVSAGLTWPEGHAFARTEIKSKEQKRREQTLDEQAAEFDFYGLEGPAARDALIRALERARGNGRRVIRLILSQQTCDFMGLMVTAGTCLGVPVVIRAESSPGIVRVVLSGPAATEPAP